MTCDVLTMERRLRRLECLQTTTARSSSSREGGKNSEVRRGLPHGPAVQKSMALRETYSNSFSGKLRQSRERTRRGVQSDSTALLHRMQGRNCLPSLSEHAETEHTSSKAANSALLNIKNILEEQKRRHVLKRQRLKEIKEANALAEKKLVVPESVRRSICSRSDDLSTITDPTFLELRNGLDYLAVGWKEEGSSLSGGKTVEFLGKELKDFGLGSNEDSSVTAASSDVSSDASFHSLSDEDDSRGSQSLEEMKVRVEVLEGEKMERDRVLSSFLASYMDAQLRFQLEEDSKETECSEIKSLLLEQREESDYLRGRLSTLENRSKTSPTTISRWMIALIVAVGFLAFGLHLSGFQNAVAAGKVNLDWNNICAPAKQGTKITEETGPLEAPWWAPDGLKAPLYQLSGCGNRPRTRVEVIRGMLRITSNNGYEELVKKPSKSAYVKGASVHIVDNRYGGHVEIQAPWVLH